VRVRGEVERGGEGGFGGFDCSGGGLLGGGGFDEGEDGGDVFETSGADGGGCHFRVVNVRDDEFWRM